MHLAVSIAVLVTLLVSPATAQVLLRDDFDGPLDPARWTVPTGDASFFGRTQIRPTMPPVSGGVVRLLLDTHNPSALVPGDSFFGSEIDTVARFPVGNGLVFEARARLVSPLPAGLVGAVFGFYFDAATGTRDEIDDELLSNDLAAGRAQVLTNVFDDDDFSRPGDKAYVALPGSGLDSFHVYQIRWLPDRIEWRIDGVLVRTETETIPDTPLSIRLNLWAPDANFSEAFDPALQPASTAAANETFAYEIDWIEIRAPETTAVLSFDGAQQLVNKDVGTERWAIGRRLANGAVTGNVFFPDGGAPRFVWCSDASPSPGAATISLACWGADRCDAAPCGSEQWNFLTEVDLDQVFFAPSQAVTWTPITPPAVLPLAFFTVPAAPTAPATLTTVESDDALPDTGVQHCRDGACTLVSKDVNDERWSITRDLTTQTVTGNVFFPDGSAPAFLWCEQTGETSATITLACRIAVDAP